MTIEQKAFRVFQSGLAFKIWNKPVSYDYLWDIRIFWAHMEYDGETTYKECNSKGFGTLENCLDDMIIYINNFESDKTQ